MRIENMEQRVANTPAVLLCDECKNKDICKWADKMRDFVVSADKAKANTPFSYIACCPHYGNDNETTQFQKDYVEEHPVYAYDLDHGIMTRKGYIPIKDNRNYIQQKIDGLAENTSAKYVRDAEVLSYDKADNV